MRRTSTDDRDDPFEEHAPVEIAPRELDLGRSGGSGADDKLPNTLVVTVLQARALPPAPLRSTLSCYVKLASLGRECKTRVLAKCDSDPCWNECFSFRALDWASSVTLSVRDKINVKVRVIGHVQISSADIANSPGMVCQHWFKLRDKHGSGAPVGDAELELKVALVYMVRNDPSVAIDIAAANQDDHEAGSGGSGMPIIADQDDETEADAFARRKEIERTDAARKHLLYTNVKQGDYQIQVHVIEARDLKGENLSGTSDPYCQVDVLGQQKVTSTKYETLGCVFDEILFFHFKNIGRHGLKHATIKIAMWDKEKVLTDNLIGAYTLDVLSVYYRPHHELYRQWIAVHDHVNKKDRGIQGFVLVSITVIGPGDALVIHDRDAELANELAAAALPSSLDASPHTNVDTSHALVLLPPTIDLKLHFLVVKLYRCEDLPAMDTGGLLLVASGIDAFVQIDFGANTACRSSVVTVRGTERLAPEFLEELWIPVLTPTLLRHIAISVWDRDMGRKDELVGLASFDYQQVQSATCPGGIMASTVTSSTAAQRLGTDDGDTNSAANDNERVELQWLHLYGPPLHRVNSKRAALVAQQPDSASTYRGRVLLSMERVETPMASESDRFHTKRIVDVDDAALNRLAPRTVKYALRCVLFCGADLPLSHHAISGGTVKTKMRVTLSIGSYDMHFDAETVQRDRSVNYEQFRERWPIVLPADLTQLPDVVVTLSRQLDRTDDFVSVAFARLAATDVFARGFSAKSEWIHMIEDVARRQTKFALDKAQSPGALLLRIGFGREEVAARCPWGDDSALFAPFKQTLVYREVRVHIFQLRQLTLRRDDARTRRPNPFVSVTCCGQRKKTAPQYKTLDPLYYESLVFTTRVPLDMVYSPDIVLHVHDANVSTSASVPAGVMGRLVVPMTHAIKTAVNASAPRPEWFALQPLRGSNTSSADASAFIDEASGEALLSIQCIDHAGPIAHLQPLESLVPVYKDAHIEIAALGVRRLKARSAVNSIQHPFLEFELLGGAFADGSSVRRSRVASSASSNAKNANFLDYLQCDAKLPVDELFAPQLRVKVCESSLGGLRKTTLAACVVDLAPKLPWSTSYVAPPPQRAFANPMPAPTVDVAALDNDKRDEDEDARGGKCDKRRRAATNRKVSMQRRAIGIQDVDDAASRHFADKSGVESDVNAVSTGSELDDDGIGIGDLLLPRVAFTAAAAGESSSDRTQRTLDPALRQQQQIGSQRRYLAAQHDLVCPDGATTLDSGRTNEATDEANATLLPAPYMAGRDWWITNHGGEELEQFLQPPALETYALYRSVLTRPSLLQRKRVRTELRAGLFKGLIAVSEHTKRLALSPLQSTTASRVLDLAQLQQPQALVVRVYVLRGRNLQAKDANGYSDPYLRLKLGKCVLSDRANHKSKTLNPDFCSLFEFNTTLPGPSQLEIGVWDHDVVTDDFIGATTIDLEDRWFHRTWQQMGERDARDDGYCLKPIEYRHLYTPKRTTSQGFLQLWVDLLTTQQAAVVPPVDIAPPAPKRFEVRVVLWRAENVVDKDASAINDYFVKAWIEGGVVEASDVHWRCASGKPCWNWRFTLPIAFPLRTAEFARLHLQLWDKDVLKWNDLVGEAQLDLYKWLQRAYATNRSVAPFQELKAIAKADGAVVSPSAAVRTSAGIDRVQRPVDSGSGSGSEDDGLSSGNDDKRDDSDDVFRGAVNEQQALLRNQKQKAKETGKTTEKRKPTAADINKAKQAKAQADAKAALGGFLDFLGLGDLPDDAEWITIHYTDRESGVSMNMGRLGVSIQIVPEHEALANPVGKGQSAPNMNPYLPPPVGRMRLSANPLLMLRELVGPAMCLRITLVCCCAGCVFFVGVFGATVMSTLTYLQSRSSSSDTGWRAPNHLRFPLPPGFQDPSVNGSTVLSPVNNSASGGGR